MEIEEEQQLVLGTYLTTILRVRKGLMSSTDSIRKSLNNVHSDGLFSLVVEGEENGKLLRVFIADKKLKPFDVQLHSHRYAINITSLHGYVKQHIATKGSQITIPEYKYRSFLNGGKGLEFSSIEKYDISEFVLPKGSTIHMSEKEIHTISCFKGSIWIVEELGFKTDDSIVLGVPFTTDGLYTEPTMFQINDKCQLVLKYVNQMLKNFGY